MTIITGLDPNSGLDLLKLTKKLKSKMATGGTFKEGNIELQGNHIYDVRDFLVKEGFDEEDDNVVFAVSIIFTVR